MRTFNCIAALLLLVSSQQMNAQQQHRAGFEPGAAPPALSEAAPRCDATVGDMMFAGAIGGVVVALLAESVRNRLGGRESRTAVDRFLIVGKGAAIGAALGVAAGMSEQARDCGNRPRREYSGAGRRSARTSFSLWGEGAQSLAPVRLAGDPSR